MRYITCNFFHHGLVRKVTIPDSLRKKDFGTGTFKGIKTLLTKYYTTNQTLIAYHMIKQKNHLEKDN